MSGHKVPPIKVPESSAPACEDVNATDSPKIEVSYDAVAQAKKSRKGSYQSALERREAECQSKIEKLEAEHQSYLENGISLRKNKIERLKNECRQALTSLSDQKKQTTADDFEKQKQAIEDKYNQEIRAAEKGLERFKTEAKLSRESKIAQLKKEVENWKEQQLKRQNRRARAKTRDQKKNQNEHKKLSRVREVKDFTSKNPYNTENVETEKFLPLKNKYSQGKLKKEEIRQFINAPVESHDGEVNHADRSNHDKWRNLSRSNFPHITNTKQVSREMKSENMDDPAVSIDDPRHREFDPKKAIELLDNHSYQPIGDEEAVDDMPENEADHRRSVSNTSTATTVIHEQTVTEEELHNDDDNNLNNPQVLASFIDNSVAGFEENRQSIADVGRKTPTVSPRVSMNETETVSRETSPAVIQTQKPTRRETANDLNPTSAKRVKNTRMAKLKAAIAATIGGGAILAEILGLVGVINAWNPVGWLCLMAATAIGTGLAVGYYSKKSH